jgi:hypothetical protein
MARTGQGTERPQSFLSQVVVVVVKLYSGVVLRENKGGEGEGEEER